MPPVVADKFLKAVDIFACLQSGPSFCSALAVGK
jgi:hypothetical protein